VLQAVTGLPFEVKDGLCTRFATEIVLRRTSSETTTVDISIIPSVDASPERKTALSEWKPKDVPADGVLTKSIMQNIFLQVIEPLFLQKFTHGNLGRRGHFWEEFPERAAYE
jgi:hypothetical protein